MEIQRILWAGTSVRKPARSIVRCRYRNGADGVANPVRRQIMKHFGFNKKRMLGLLDIEETICQEQIISDRLL